MTAFTDKLSDFARVPVTLVVITGDWCSHTFNTSPCAGTGIKCFNTYATCRDKDHYAATTKDYEFTSLNAPLPFPGPRPYVKSVKEVPTEITDKFTISGRAGIEMADEPDTDVGIDPYYPSRTTPIPGTFWKKWLARNPNYEDFPVKVYDGFYGLNRSQFVQRIQALLDNVTVDKSGGCTIELVDPLQRLDDVYVPPKMDVKLVADMTDSQLALSVYGEDYDLLPESAFSLTISDEVIYVGTRTDNQCTGLLRAQFGSEASTHSTDDKVQLCRYYEPQSPYDVILTMLTDDVAADAAVNGTDPLDPSLINTGSFTFWKAFDTHMVLFSTLITEPTKLKDLIFEIVDLIDCKCWVAEDLKITIRKNLQNYPGRVYKELSDADNIIEGSISPDLNAKSRVDTIYLYWNKSFLGKADDETSYGHIDIVKYNGPYKRVAEKIVYCRWIRDDYMNEDLIQGYIRRLGARMLRLYKDAMPLVTLSVELKDSDVTTGSWVHLTTSALQRPDGSDLNQATAEVVKREKKGNVVELELLVYPERGIAYIQPATGANDYTSATSAQKEYGFIANSQGEMSNGDQGYTIY